VGVPSRGGSEHAGTSTAGVRGDPVVGASPAATAEPMVSALGSFAGAGELGGVCRGDSVAVAAVVVALAAPVGTGTGFRAAGAACSAAKSAFARSKARRSSCVPPMRKQRKQSQSSVKYGEGEEKTPSANFRARFRPCASARVCREVSRCPLLCRRQVATNLKAVQRFSEGLLLGGEVRARHPGNVVLAGDERVCEEPSKHRTEA